MTLLDAATKVMQDEMIKNVSNIEKYQPVSLLHDQFVLIDMHQTLLLALTQKLLTTLPFLICVRKTSGKVTEQIQSKYYLGSLSNIVGNSIGFQLHTYILRHLHLEKHLP